MEGFHYYEFINLVLILLLALEGLLPKEKMKALEGRITEIYIQLDDLSILERLNRGLLKLNAYLRKHFKKPLSKEVFKLSLFINALTFSVMSVFFLLATTSLDMGNLEDKSKVIKILDDTYRDIEYSFLNQNKDVITTNFFDFYADNDFSEDQKKEVKELLSKSINSLKSDIESYSEKSFKAMIKFAETISLGLPLLLTMLVSTLTCFFSYAITFKIINKSAFKKDYLSRPLYIAFDSIAAVLISIIVMSIIYNSILHLPPILLRVFTYSDELVAFGNIFHVYIFGFFSYFFIFSDAIVYNQIISLAQSVESSTAPPSIHSAIIDLVDSTDKFIFFDTKIWGSFFQDIYFFFTLQFDKITISSDLRNMPVIISCLPTFIHIFAIIAFVFSNQIIRTCIYILNLCSRSANPIFKNLLLIATTILTTFNIMEKLVN